jgi:hypothetical protein
LKDEREYIKVRVKLKNHSEYYQPGCEVDTECYRDKIIRRLKKKRWKKYKKLWKNTISLQVHKGKIFIDKNFIVEREKQDMI